MKCYIPWRSSNSICTVHVDIGLVKGQTETNHLFAILSAPYVHTDNSVQIFMSTLKAAVCYLQGRNGCETCDCQLVPLKKFHLELKQSREIIMHDSIAL